MKIQELLDGIYGKDACGVFVFDLSGNLVWKNAASDSLGVSPEKLLTEIRLCGNESGLLLSGVGYCHSAEILEKQYIIAEVYPQERVAAMFGNELFRKYAMHSDSQVRQAVTGISASCELINDAFESGNEKNASECLESIMTNCCHLIRNTSLSLYLASAMSGKNKRCDMIFLPSFTEQLAEGCSAALGKDGCSVCTDVPVCMISADRELLIYFLLMLVRKIMPYKNMQLNISAKSDGEYAVIILSSEEKVSTPDSEKTSNGGDILDEAYSIIAEKLGVDCEISEFKAAVKIRCAPYNGEIRFETDRQSLSDGIFSPCRVMLGDLTDYRCFY